MRPRPQSCQSSDPAPAQLGCPRLKITKASVITLFAPLLPWGFLPSKSPKCLQWSRPCPGGVSHPHNYQSIAFYNVRASAQVGCHAVEHCYLQCSRSCPGRMSRAQSYQCIAIYNVRAPAQVGCPAVKVAKVSLLSRAADRWPTGKAKRGYLRFCSCGIIAGEKCP